MNRIRRWVSNLRFVRREILKNFVVAEQKDLVFGIVATRNRATEFAVWICVRHLLDPYSLIGIKSHVNKTLASMVDAILIVRPIKTIQVRTDIAPFPCDSFTLIVIRVRLKNVLADEQSRIFGDINNIPRERRRDVAIFILRVTPEFDFVTHNKYFHTHPIDEFKPRITPRGDTRTRVRITRRRPVRHRTFFTLRAAVILVIRLARRAVKVKARITTRRIASTRVRITRRRPVRHRTFFTLRAAVILVIRLARRAVEVKARITTRRIARARARVTRRRAIASRTFFTFRTAVILVIRLARRAVEIKARITPRRITRTRVRITRRRPVRHRTFFTLRAAVILVIRLARRAVEVKARLTPSGLA